MNKLTMLLVNALIMLFGFMVAKLPGAILGLIISIYFIKSWNQINKKSKAKNNHKNILFFRAAFITMGYIARHSKVDNGEDLEHAEKIMYQFNFDSSQSRLAMYYFEQGKNGSIAIKPVLKNLKIISANSPELITLFMQIQANQALSVQRWNKKKYLILMKVATILHFDKAKLNYLLKEKSSFINEDFKHDNLSDFNFVFPKTLSQAYKVLEISNDADFMSVKNQYRRLISKHHPDKMIAKGFPQEMIKIAKVKSQQISAAYELIKKYGA